MLWITDKGGTCTTDQVRCSAISKSLEWVGGDSVAAMSTTGSSRRLMIALALVAFGLAGCAQSSEPESAKEPSNGAGGFVADTKPVPPARWLDATVPKGATIKLSM